MVEDPTASHFPDFQLMGAPVTVLFHFIVTNVNVTENDAKYRYR